MGMSRTDFNNMATEFGMIYREIDFDSDEWSKAKRTHTTDDAVFSFMRVARTSNSQFDTARFLNFINDVRIRVRDNTGKLVKGKVNA